MKIKKVKISDISPNPFKKFINNGRLNDEIVEKLMDSIETIGFHENIIAREHDSEVQLLYGHHRIEAMKRKFGKSHEIELQIKSVSDEDMLRGMVLENVTQRDTDAQDLMDSVVLVRTWLSSGVSDVQAFHNTIKGKKGFQSIASPDSSRSIANFLSKQGKSVSYRTIANYLNIHDNLDSDLIGKVTRRESVSTSEDDSIGIVEATVLSKLDKKEQKPILKQIKEEGWSHRDTEHYVSRYKNAPEETKKKVLEGKLRLDQLATKPTEEVTELIHEEAQKIAKEIEDSYDNNSDAKHDIKLEKLMVSLGTISALLKAKKLYCPEHKKSEVIWACCKEPITKTHEKLRKQLDGD